MKRLLLICLMFTSATAPTVFASEQTILARITVYWPSGSEPQRASSNGAKLHGGHCAVDPKKIPYGSKVIFPDGPCVAVDSGPAVISRMAARKCAKTALQRSALVIDRYFETKKQALIWAATHPHFMTVRVLDPHDRVAEAPKGEGQTPKHFDDSRSVATGTEQTTGSTPSSGNGSASADIRGLISAFFGTTLPRF